MTLQTKRFSSHSTEGETERFLLKGIIFKLHSGYLREHPSEGNSQILQKKFQPNRHTLRNIDSLPPTVSL